MIDLDPYLERLLSVVPSAVELAVDPISRIPEQFGIPVIVRDASQTAGLCTVNGSYFSDPPRIRVARASIERRIRFTALHELAHHLIRGDLSFVRVFAGDRQLEERLCDRFAIEILLPKSLIDYAIDRDGVVAQTFLNLYKKGCASRTATARSLAERLPSAGHILLTEGSVAVRSVGKLMALEVEPGTDQGRQGPIAVALEKGKSSGLGRIIYGLRTQSDNMPIEVLSPILLFDAVSDENFVFAVAMLADPPIDPDR